MNSAQKLTQKPNKPEILTQKENLGFSEAAQYIADMLLELRKLAKAAELKNLHGLLELSYYEAFSAANRVAIPEGESERLEQMGADARKAEST